MILRSWPAGSGNREEVIGMGEEKTPKSFRAACTVFTNLEILLDQDVRRV